MSDRERWLAQVAEDVLEPALPICDPHHHLWDHPGRRYLLDELLADTGSGHNVVATVFVECMSMYRADGEPALRRVGETLDAHAAASPRFRGIRHAAGWDASEHVRNSHTNPPPGLLGDARFR